MQVRSLGRRQCGGLFLLGDELIDLTPLHAMLAVSVADMLPVSPGELFSADAKRLARSASLKAGPAKRSYEALMNSPWKVGFVVTSRLCLLSCMMEDTLCNSVPRIRQMVSVGDLLV